MSKRSMTAVRLNTDHLDALKRPPAGVIRYYADPVVMHLRLRASVRGFTWLFTGRLNGTSSRHPLGKYPRMTLDQARTVAMRLADAGALPANPVTFAQLRAAYLGSTEFAALAKRTQQSYRWVLESKHYVGFATRKVREITRQDVLALKDDIARSGRAYQNILRPLQALFTWGLDRGYIDVSPAMRLKLPQNEIDPQPFTEAEMGAMLVAVSERGLEEPWRSLYMLTAYTGQRPSTWGSSKWTELDLNRCTLKVSRSRGRKTKLGRGWAIPLAPPVVEILKAMRKEQGRARGEWLFGRELVVEQKVRDRAAKLAGLAGEGSRGTLHRFRATMLTILTQWGVDTETQQRLSGHSSPMLGSRAAYVVPEPTPAMRAVAERYANWIDGQVMLYG